MVYRRIIQLSPTTKVVSIPSSWLSKNGVKKGDSVDVEESGNRLIIETIKSGDKSLSSDLTELNDDLLWTAIDAFYMLGYSHMELKVNPRQKQLLAKIVQFFPMFIIASETKNMVELKAVASNLDMDFEKTLQHIRHMTINIVDEAISMIQRKDWTSLAKIKKMDYTLNTYISMCFRNLNAGKVQNAVTWAQYVKILESYADRLCMLFEGISKYGSITKNDVASIKNINVLYDESFKLLGKFSIQKANEHDKARHSLEESFAKSQLHVYFRELTRSIYDMHEIIFQLHQEM